MYSGRISPKRYLNTKFFQTNKTAIAHNHLESVQRICGEKRINISLRLTEGPSIYLQQRGFSTKSMDIHGKSANSGLAAGFVPVDPFFSKMPPVHQEKPLDEKSEVYQKLRKPHREAVATQLYMTSEMIADYLDTEIIKRKNVAEKNDGITYYSSVTNGVERKYMTKAEVPDNPTHHLVYWLDDNNIPHPLEVWGYPDNSNKNRIIPVTGDVDISMILPEYKVAAPYLIPFTIKDEHGESIISPGELKLIGDLNAACGRINNPLFNHGTEHRNYDFTQVLDLAIQHVSKLGQKIITIVNYPSYFTSSMKNFFITRNPNHSKPDSHFSGTSVSPVESFKTVVNAAEYLKRSSISLPASGECKSTIQTRDKNTQWHHALYLFGKMKEESKPQFTMNVINARIHSESVKLYERSEGAERERLRCAREISSVIRNEESDILVQLRLPEDVRSNDIYKESYIATQDGIFYVDSDNNPIHISDDKYSYNKFINERVIPLLRGLSKKANEKKQDAHNRHYILTANKLENLLPSRVTLTASQLTTIIPMDERWRVLTENADQYEKAFEWNTADKIDFQFYALLRELGYHTFNKATFLKIIDTQFYPMRACIVELATKHATIAEVACKFMSEAQLKEELIAVGLQGLLTKLKERSKIATVAIGLPCNNFNQTYNLPVLGHCLL